MFKVITDTLVPFVKKKKHGLLCHRLAILEEKVTLEIIEIFNNHAKVKNSTCHFWVTPKVSFIFS